MKAVILAGGLGTRLRPLTYRIPKPLVPVAGRSLIVRIIDSLPSSVDTVVLAVSYMKEAVEEYFRVNPCGKKVLIVNETTPLGTGGALKNVAEHLDSTFIALNGDCLSTLDFKAMVRQHRENGGIGTIALWEVEDPSAFGVVALDKGSRILDFQEKPKREEAKSKLINAGAYVFEPEILDYIGKGQVSMEREVFPNLLEEGLFGFRFQGFWVDCGTRANLLAAQTAVLEREGSGARGGHVDPGCQLYAPYLTMEATVGRCSLGPNVVVEGATIGDGASVRNSLIMRGAQIGSNAAVVNSIIGPGMAVAKDTHIIDTILAEK